MKTRLSVFTAITILMFAFASKSYAQKSPLEKVWYNEDKSAKVEIYQGKDGKFYGRIIWLKEPIDKGTGKPQADVENPDPKLRTRPVQGLVILYDFVPDAGDKNIYADGSIYDPDSGKTYCGKITFKGNTLDLRGYLCSFSLFGRTETWTVAGAN